MDYIARALEKRLYKYEKTYKAVLITGARQVGKSTLLKKVFPDRKYVSLDDPFLEQQAKEAGSIFANVGICVGTKNWRQYGIWVYSGNS